MKRIWTRRKLRLFYSYCHRDDRYRRELCNHLSLLRRENLIDEWYDGEIGAGRQIDDEIRKNLACSDVIVLMISADFLASDYIWQNELNEALERHKRNEARVLPVIVRPVEDHWQTTVFGRLKALPKDGKPVTRWRSRDQAWANVVNGIRQAIMEVRSPARRTEASKVRRRKGGS
jgi:internalin A